MKDWQWIVLVILLTIVLAMLVNVTDFVVEILEVVK